MNCGKRLLISRYSIKPILSRLVMIVLTTVITFNFISYIVGFESGGDYVSIAYMMFSFTLLTEFIVFFEWFQERKCPLTIDNFHKRSVKLLLASVAFGVLIFYTSYTMLCDTSIMSQEVENRGITAFIVLTITLVIIELGIASIYRVTVNWHKMSKEMDLLNREKSDMALQVLQDKINPHFLFNNLSTLKSLIMLKHDSAALNFIQNFSDIYRYVLDNSSKTTISISEELQFIDRYIALHTERIGEGIVMDIQIPPAVVHKHILPMTLQLLVENAIKHNIADEDELLYIDIFVENNLLVVKNSLNLKESTYSTKQGLDNLIRRYKLLTDGEVSITKVESSFIVKVPFI